MLRDHVKRIVCLHWSINLSLENGMQSNMIDTLNKREMTRSLYLYQSHQAVKDGIKLTSYQVLWEDETFE